MNNPAQSCVCRLGVRVDDARKGADIGPKSIFNHRDEEVLDVVHVPILSCRVDCSVVRNFVGVRQVRVPQHRRKLGEDLVECSLAFEGGETLVEILRLHGRHRSWAIFFGDYGTEKKFFPLLFRLNGFVSSEIYN